MPSPYVYRSAIKRALAWAIDAVLDLVFKPVEVQASLSQARSIAVLRLDHLGDILNTAPFLAALKRACPRAKVTLFVGPWGEAAARLTDADEIMIVPAPWFERPQRQAWPWRAIWNLGLALRENHFDAVLEPRGETRHLLACALSGVPLRLGFALSVGRAFLTHQVEWKPGLHESEQALRLIHAGFEGASRFIQFVGARSSAPLKVGTDAKRRGSQLARDLKLGSGYIAVQARSGTRAKLWMDERWVELLKKVSKLRPCVLVGSENEAAELRSLAKRCGPKVKVAAGRMDIATLGAFLAKAKLMISLDSGPAHLAAALGTPLVSLYSATNRPEQWAPRGRVTLLRHETPCSPCELSACPYENECMRRISVDEAWVAVKKSLGARRGS